ncbi:hypothetical protein BSKO_03287 [Bryopsis sp. KO-2023]|nr:hypothetical protein BSKO_03287 [Bryopsis sp. KO-2023]
MAGGEVLEKSSKLAMGMSVEYKITFKPESYDDYFYELVVCTEREKFIVPITAVGRRPALDFPDKVDLGLSPVKISTKKFVLVTNVGEKAGKFDLITQPPFFINPTRGVLGPNESLQCIVGCCPHIVGVHESELSITYDYGEAVFSKLRAVGREVDVDIPAPTVDLLPTYVTKASLRTFKISNASETVVKFSVRAADDLMKEVEGTLAKLKKLNCFDGDINEMSILERMDLTGFQGDENNIYSDSALHSIRGEFLEAKDIKLQSQLFQAQNFTIHPLEGTIPARGEIEITVEFRPTYAKDYETVAFVDIQGRENRIPVTIRAKGLGPEAVFSYDALDVGDTFINTLHQYEVELQNRGKIDAKFQLLPPNTEFGSKFRFEPDHGSLVAGQVQIIKVNLMSDILGAFHQTFRWEILSSSKPLILEFIGRVVGPSFQVDSNELDFGIVSYGFRYTKQFNLKNTSEIPMRFNWHIPNDSNEAPEFNICPKSGMILPMGKQNLSIDFTSQTVQVYTKDLVLDIPGVGEGLHIVPIVAECAVPKIKIESDVLEFGQCYIRHPCKKSFRLINESKLPAKFEVLQQDAHSRSLATFTAEPSTGGIAAQGEQVVEFTLSTSRLGRIQLPVLVRVIGSSSPPLHFAIEARSIGPLVTATVAGASPRGKLLVDFGKVDVLEEHSVTLTIHNPSPIPAEYKTFIEGKDSIFEIDKRTGVLNPAESAEFTLSTCLDEAKRFKDTLHILVTEGADIDIPLIAVGVGCTVVCPDLASGFIDFGDQFTGRAFTKEVMLYNLDRRPVNLQWINETAVMLKKELSKRNVKQAQDKGTEQNAETEPVYAVAPERLTIGPKESAPVVISGMSMHCGAICEKLTCKGGIGPGAKASRLIFEVSLKSEVAVPLLEFSEQEVRFAYYYKKGFPMSKITKDITITNVSRLPLTFTLRAPPPFLVTPDATVLNPGDPLTVQTVFDPSFRGDYESALTRSRITIAYADNSKKDGVDLVGEIHRPNLKFDSSKVDFGSVLTDTNRRIVMNVTNCSSLTVVYHWTLSDEENGGGSPRSVKTKPKLANQMFDILPIKGVLEPGEVERMEFSYFAYPGQKSSAIAVCHVDGGPDYEMPLIAESNSIKFSVEPTQLNLGCQLFDRTTDREVVIANQGKVPFDFCVNLKSLSRKGIVDCVPSIGRVGPGHKEAVRFKVCPGLPVKLDETVYFELGHFDPIPIKVSVEGVYPTGVLTLPRAKDDTYQEFLDDAQQRLIQLGPKIRLLPKSPKSIASRASPSQRSPNARRAMDKPTSPPSMRRESRSVHGVPVAPQKASPNPLFDLGYSRADLEAEADRLRFCAELVTKVTSKESKQKQSRECTPRSETRFSNKEERTSNSKKKCNTLSRPCRKHSHLAQISFQLNKQVLEGYGLSIDPESIPKLQGAPDYESLEMTLSLNTSKSKVPNGTLDLVFPIEIKFGPAILLAIKAQIMMPEIKVSSNVLEFGEVQVGHCKTIPVMFSNPKDVPCEWCIKKPVESTKAKDWQFFQFDPHEGYLEPGESTLVKISFTPAPNRDAPYEQGIPIKVNNSSKSISIDAIGRGHTLRLSFDKNSVDLGAIVPAFEGQESRMQAVNIINPNAYPIEVVCLNFDERYRSDDQVLRDYKHFDEEDNAYFPPLNPGVDLWSDLVTTPQDIETGDDVATEDNGSDGQNQGDTDLKDDFSAEEKSLDSSRTASQGESMPPKKDRVIVIVQGPPHSGKTTQAKKMSSRYNIPVTTFDGLIEDAQEIEATADLEDLNEEVSEALSQFDVELTVADIVVEMLTGGVDIHEDEQRDNLPEAYSNLSPEAQADLLLFALRAGMKTSKHENGFVIDGLASRFLQRKDVGELLLLSMGLRKEEIEPDDSQGDQEDDYEENLERFTWAPSEEFDDKIFVIDLSMSWETYSNRYLKIQKGKEDSNKTESDGNKSETHEESDGTNDDNQQAKEVDSEIDAIEKMPSEAGSAMMESEDKETDEEEGDLILDPETQELHDAFIRERDEVEEIAPVWGDQLHSSNCVRLRTVEVDEEEEQVHKRVCGIQFNLGTITTAMPQVEADKEIIPDPYTLQIVHRPKSRIKRQPIKRFKIITPCENESQASGSDALVEEEEEEGSDIQPKRSEQSRWIIQPKESQPLVVEFSSEDVGSFQETLAFEIVCPGAPTRPSSGNVFVYGVCDYPRISEDYRSVFYRKTRVRPRSPLVSRQFIISRERFEFGPLLAGKTNGDNEDDTNLENCGKFRILNNGLFDLHVDFVLESANSVADKGPPAKGGKGKTEAAPTTPFSFDPKAMDLGVGEMKDLLVYAFPGDVGEYEDVILCQVEGNPNPVTFPLSCVGSKPAVVLKSSEEELPEGEQDEIYSSGIVFDRLLLGRTELKKFKIHNTGLLPFKWNLEGADKLAEEFSVYPSSGAIEARSYVEVTVELNAMDTIKELKEVMNVQVIDCQELQGIVHDIPIQLKGETYKIEVDLSDPSDLIDFGTVRVCDDGMKNMTITNRGKYAVDYSFLLKSPLVKEIFRVTPAEGTIEPSKNAVVEVHFNPEHKLGHEICLALDPEVFLSIFEPMTGMRELHFPIRLSANAVFSKYALTPARGINFGSMQYDTTSEPRTFQISNLGEFPFDFTLTNNSKTDDTSASPPEKGKGKSAAADSIEIGAFTIVPSKGTIEPGNVAEIAVTFQASGSQYNGEAINIGISEMDPSDSPSGIVYEVAGESCIPGIDAQNIDAIFEEHLISPQLDPFNPVNGEFGRKEKAFNFGAVTARLSGGESTDEQDDANCVKANLKFINPVKIPSTVHFSIKPQGEWTSRSGEAYPFVVKPESVTIPPHENTYVSVYFMPRAIQSFVATLEATVSMGCDQDTKGFSCQVRGEGMLPSLTLQVPTVDSENKPILNFPRMMKGRSQTLPIHAKNNGILPATGRIDMEAQGAFQLEGGCRTFTLESKKSLAFNVEFAPEDTGVFEQEVQIKVRENPFELYRVKLMGECFVENIVFEGLTDDSDDQLDIGDVRVGGEKEVFFRLRNNSSENYRFSWPSAPNLEFSPSVGHIHIGAAKEIKAIFKSDEKIKLDPADIHLEVQQISYVDEPIEWDNALQNSDAHEEQESLPEPEHTPMAGTASDRVLKIFAVADEILYECDSAPINFRPTMMFQSRSFPFTFTNPSTAKMNFRWAFTNMDGTPDTSGLYTVSPEGGIVDGEGNVEIVVKFNPEEVQDCRRTLVCTIPNLSDDATPLFRPVNGRVLRPWCHFDLPESDYISSGRRVAEMPGPSGGLDPPDPATKVLELVSLGVKVRNTKRFHVLNPTNIAYEFFWEPIKGPGAPPPSSPFTCITRHGVISSGRKYEMAFDFTPLTHDVHEAFWVFKIPEHGIEAPFLLVGEVSEPRVSFDRPSINFGKLLIGARSRVPVSLVNDEHLPFTFKLVKTTFEASDDVIRSTGKRPIVEFNPSSGIVPPNSRLELIACFRPRLEESINYNVTCIVAKKPQPLTVNVKGEGYVIHSSVQMDGPDGSIVELSDGVMNNISFGQVIINERCIKQIALVNSGNINYDFVWSIGTNPRITVHPETGSVAQGERFVCELCYNPHVPEKLDNYKVTCSIVNGRRYTMNLMGVGHKPRLDLSFYRHDFGMVFINEEGMAPVTKILRARNDDNREISFDVLFENNENLQISCPPTVLGPGEYKDIMISLSPKAAQLYQFTVPLEINGLYTLNVFIRGEGTPMRIELLKPSDRALNLGAIGPYHSSTKVVKIANKSRIAANISLQPSLAALEALGIDILPSTDLFLRGRESGDVTFFFRPPGRLPPFAEPFEIEVCGVRIPILTLSGACLGTEIRLASSTLPFGAVTRGSRSCKRLQLENTGDVGTRFVWNTGGLGQNFSIFPQDGFLPPGRDVKLEIAFHPVAVSPDIRVERVRCKVDGGEDQFLTLTGACAESQPQSEAVVFSCGVRSTTEKNITIENASGGTWQLRPAIQNDYWSGPEFLTVPAGGKADYHLTYSPLMMSSQDQPHKGSVFFPIPDGTGLLYSLEGVADSPVAEATVEQTVPAKSLHIEALRVHNWLQKPQRFRVDIERVQCDESTSAQGPEYVDVPPLSSKMYKLSFYSYTENVSILKVTFTNESTGEFVFYDVKLVASTPQSQGDVHLECPVRTQATQNISIRNPLSKDVAATASCNNRQVSVAGDIVLKSNSATSIPVAFRPLVVGEASVPLTLRCPELGQYEYNLELKGVPAGPERSLTFNVPLGSLETQVFRFTHWLPDKCEYKCYFKRSGTTAAPDSPFSVVPTVKAEAAGAKGTELEVEVSFEPIMIGESARDVLVLGAPNAGEYECPVVGSCVQPKPQGPIDLSKGSSGVPFKNVFGTEVEFFYSVENACFTVKASEKIAAKKAVSIPVSYKDNGSGVSTGRLTITCPNQSDAQWVFYLKA